ncbi:hypothetical protein BU16DRAFT_564265 [Lophium mytilinum]|uniref:Cora-domain-containing protein n=1 Tax=Lophium mytilinum TaxID=390894 RepID=A0A6A6QMK0_9PEZI|nr:hypothetical protein BU16DRAFT_564265 [Lophium mytilinum]
MAGNSFISSRRGARVGTVFEVLEEAGGAGARVHTIADKDGSSEIPAEQCLVSGKLDHVEFDLSYLREVISYVQEVYPEGFALTEGLDPTIGDSEFYKETNPASDSRVLRETCAFVGEILDFGQKGYCVRSVDAFTKGAFWDVIRSSGYDAPPSFKGGLHLNSSHLSRIGSPTVGRIIVVETISSKVLVALHTALEHFFAVTTTIDLYPGESRLGSDVPYDEMSRARHYAIKYLYILSFEDRVKLPMRHRLKVKELYKDKKADFYIGLGTTAMQLSEEIDQVKGLPPYAPFKPWSILVVPAVPHLRLWREHRLETDVRLANASEAWIWVIAAEHKYVYDHMMSLFQKISAKVSPPRDFMFNLDYIEELLFDDENYTKSELYFWAHQSLEMIQGTLKEIIEQWDMYSSNTDLFDFRKESQRSEKAKHYAARMEQVSKGMEDLIKKFRGLIEDCKSKQKAIAALRDGLFNGSAVLESRNSSKSADQSLKQSQIAIAQGENIKILTLVSIFFLPLAFVTSVFGMTNLPSSVSMKSFGIALVFICIPSYTLIGSFMSERGMNRWHAIIGWFEHNVYPQRWRTLKIRNVLLGSFWLANWEWEPWAPPLNQPPIPIRRAVFSPMMVDESTSSNERLPVDNSKDVGVTQSAHANEEDEEDRTRARDQPSTTATSKGQQPTGNGSKDQPLTDSGRRDQQSADNETKPPKWRLWNRGGPSKETLKGNKERDVEKEAASRDK